MRSFEYGDEEIGQREIVFAVASMLIGIGILTLPRMLASTTQSVDGWMSIVIGGIFSTLFAWIIAKLGSRFPKKTFLHYSSLIISKPVGILLTLALGLSFLGIVSIETRVLGDITKLYMFDRTPSEVLSLAFLLIVVYAVSGSRAALLRLNLLFLPIVVFISCLVQFMNIGFFEVDNLKPIFVTGWTGILQGVKETTFAFLGYTILLFYITFMNRPKEAPKAAIIGMTIPTVLYLLVYVSAIGVFSHVATKNIMYPTIEIAKEVEVPGEFFERFESIFFTIFIMTIFNTTTMAFDVTILALNSVFRSIKKMTWIFFLSPIIYFMALIPRDQSEVDTFAQWIAYFNITYILIVPILLLSVAHLRGVNGND
jgi:spore germination protein